MAPEKELGEHLVPVLGQVVRLLRQIEVPGEPSLATLAVLRRLDARGHDRVTDLARAERASQPAMTQLIGRMERAGLVVRVHDPHDGRGILVEITSIGRDLLRHTENQYAEALNGLLGRLSAADRSAIDSALPALANLVSAADLPTGSFAGPVFPPRS